MAYIHVYDNLYDNEETDNSIHDSNKVAPLANLGAFAPNSTTVMYDEDFGTPLAKNTAKSYPVIAATPLMTPPCLEMDDSLLLMQRQLPSSDAMYASLKDPFTWSSLFDESPTEVPQLTSDLPHEIVRPVPHISMSLSDVYARLDKQRTNSTEGASSTDEEAKPEPNYDTKPIVSAPCATENTFEPLLKTEFETFNSIAPVPVAPHSVQEAHLDAKFDTSPSASEISSCRSSNTSGNVGTGSESKLTEEERSSLKRARNTMAARRSRARRVEKLADLERKCQFLTARNQELESEVYRLRYLLERSTHHSTRCMGGMPPL